jgi:hypothetical protein
MEIVYCGVDANEYIKVPLFFLRNERNQRLLFLPIPFVAYTLIMVLQAQIVFSSDGPVFLRL